jgi:hypothetical protein
MFERFIKTTIKIIPLAIYILMDISFTSQRCSYVVAIPYIVGIWNCVNQTATPVNDNRTMGQFNSTYKIALVALHRGELNSS